MGDQHTQESLPQLSPLPHAGALPGVAPPHPPLDAPDRPGVAPPHPLLWLGVLELAFQAGVFPPSALGLGVRDDAFQAGVLPPSAYGFGVRDDGFHEGVRASPTYGLAVRPAPQPGVRAPELL